MVKTEAIAVRVSSKTEGGYQPVRLKKHGVVTALVNLSKVLLLTVPSGTRLEFGMAYSRVT